MTKVEDRHRAAALYFYDLFYGTDESMPPFDDAEQECLGGYEAAMKAAKALAEAEKRGAETEREACAEEAESQWAYCSPRHVAAAIRARSSK